MVGWLAASSSTSSPTALSPERREVRMSRRVDSAMTANTSSVTMPPTLATYTPKGINYFAGPSQWEAGRGGAILVEPGVQSVQWKHGFPGGHHGTVHGVVGVESHFPGAPPELHVVAHQARRRST